MAYTNDVINKKVVALNKDFQAIHKKHSEKADGILAQTSDRVNKPDSKKYAAALEVKRKIDILKKGNEMIQAGNYEFQNAYDNYMTKKESTRFGFIKSRFPGTELYMKRVALGKSQKSLNASIKIVDKNTVKFKEQLGKYDNSGGSFLPARNSTSKIAIFMRNLFGSNQTANEPIENFFDEESGGQLKDAEVEALLNPKAATKSKGGFLSFFFCRTNNTDNKKHHQARKRPDQGG